MHAKTSPGRNDPCPCGSGKKYKKCCGQVVPIASVAAIAPPARIATEPQERQCGGCTACCDGWLRATIYGHEMEPGTPCHFVQPGGCSIYDQRPLKPCRKFECSWVRPNSPFPETFKPSESGVIIMPFNWRGQPTYRLTSAGRDPAATMLDWMMRFSQQTGISFFYEMKGRTVGYGSPAFQNVLAQLVARGEPLW